MAKTMLTVFTAISKNHELDQDCKAYAMHFGSRQALEHLPSKCMFYCDDSNVFLAFRCAVNWCWWNTLPHAMTTSLVLGRSWHQICGRNRDIIQFGRFRGQHSDWYG